MRSQPTHIFRQSADMHRPALGRTVFRHTTIAFEPVRVSGRDQGRLASMFMELRDPMSLMASALTRPE